MAMKTVLRRLCKILPQSIDRENLARAIALDEQGDANLSQRFDVELPAEVPMFAMPAEVPPEEQGRRMPLGAKKDPPKVEEKKTERSPGEEG
jgi:recombinational DNA repair protein RecT